MNAPESVPSSDLDPAIDPRLEFCNVAVVLPEVQKLTPSLIANMRDMLPDDKKVGCYFAFDSASYVNVVGNNELVAAMDHVQTRRELLLTGRLGALLGMDLLTDAYVHPDRKVLPAKRVYVMAGDGTTGVACNIC